MRSDWNRRPSEYTSTAGADFPSIYCVERVVESQARWSTSHRREAAIDEQFDPVNVAGVVASQE